MPYDAQGRWIEENEWEQMMRELAAQRVQAFSRYNDAPPSLYPNQAAPYRSFPYADPTPAIWDTSPDSILNPAVPSDPKYQGWGFNQEPIADTSAVSGIPFTGLQTVSGTQSMEDILANAQKSQGVKTDIQNLIEMYGDPSTEVTDDPYAAPVSDPNIVTSGPLVPDQSRWDMLPAVPGTGDAIPMPNMEVDQPIATGMVQAGLGNYDHLGNLISINPQGPFVLPSYRRENQTEVLPITVSVLPGLATALTAGAVTAATAGEGVQPGDRDYGMAGGGVGPTMGGHPGIGPGGGYDLSALPDFAAADQAVADQQAIDTITPSGDVNLAGMPFAGAVTGAEALINEAPFVSANPLSVLAKTGMMSNLANFDAGPVVQEVFDTIMPTAQAAPVAAPVAAPAKPSGPSPADIARMAQAAAARQRQQAIEFERMENRLVNLQGRDRGVDPSEVAALEAALGGYRGDPVGRQAGRTRGGFDPQGGTTGSSGMGAWT